MIKLTPYREFDTTDPEDKVLVNPREIAAVEPYLYHSFRPAISCVTLQCGRQIVVWETVNELHRRLADANSTEEEK